MTNEENARRLLGGRRSETWESGEGEVESYTPDKTEDHDEIVIRTEDGRRIRISNNTVLGRALRAKSGDRVNYHGYRVNGTDVVHKVHQNAHQRGGWLEHEMVKRAAPWERKLADAFERAGKRVPPDLWYKMKRYGADTLYTGEALYSSKRILAKYRKLLSKGMTKEQAMSELRREVRARLNSHRTFKDYASAAGPSGSLTETEKRLFIHTGNPSWNDVMSGLNLPENAAYVNRETGKAFARDLASGKVVRKNTLGGVLNEIGRPVIFKGTQGIRGVKSDLPEWYTEFPDVAIQYAYGLNGDHDKFFNSGILDVLPMSRKLRRIADRRFAPHIAKPKIKDYEEANERIRRGATSLFGNPVSNSTSYTGIDNNPRYETVISGNELDRYGRLIRKLFVPDVTDVNTHLHGFMRQKEMPVYELLKPRKSYPVSSHKATASGVHQIDLVEILRKKFSGHTKMAESKLA